MHVLYCILEYYDTENQFRPVPGTRESVTGRLHSPAPPISIVPTQSVIALGKRILLCISPPLKKVTVSFVITNAWCVTLCRPLPREPPPLLLLSEDVDEGEPDAFFLLLP